MFEWIDKKVLEAKHLSNMLGFEWQFAFNNSASVIDVARCEDVIGIKLPYSFHNFLLRSNGAHLFSNCLENLRQSPSDTWSETGILIFGTEALIKKYDELKVDYQELNESFDLSKILPICYLGSIGTGDFCALDARGSASIEYAVIDCDHDYLPEDWCQSVIALSFDQWLAKLFERVTNENKHPEYWIGTEDFSTSGNYAASVAADLIAQEAFAERDKGNFVKAFALLQKSLELQPDNDFIKEISDELKALI